MEQHDALGEQADRAARLAKADLLTRMVKEKDAEIADLERRLARLEAVVERLSR